MVFGQLRRMEENNRDEEVSKVKRTRAQISGRGMASISG